jgi:L-seryl-tRNA(Ser) seleniumtransferase
MVGVYERLGVTPVINARGMNTMASGSLMDPRVIDAMREASSSFVDMAELNQKAGQRIADLIGVEAAHVTSGAAGGLVLAAAAVVAGTDPAAIAQLPDTTGLRHELVMQRAHRFSYNQAFKVCGAKLIEVGDEEGATADQVEAAINDKTAALVYIVSPYLGSRAVPESTMAEIAHRHGLPFIVDAASTLPPSSHLRRWYDQGADLVIYSGGKGIRGPQGSGILLGRANLIKAAAMNGAPNASIARACKVTKEDIVGLVTALELFLDQDWQKEWDHHLAEARVIENAVKDLPGVSTNVDNDSSVWTTPTLLIDIDKSVTGASPEDVVNRLRSGNPPIMTRVFKNRWLLVDPHNLRGDEAQIVGKRLREILAAQPVPVPARA